MDTNQTNEIRESARRLAAQRRIVEGHCEICGNPFEGTRKRRYCSHNCAQKAYVRRRLEQQAQQEGQDGK